MCDDKEVIHHPWFRPRNDVCHDSGLIRGYCFWRSWPRNKALSKSITMVPTSEDVTSAVMLTLLPRSMLSLSIKVTSLNRIVVTVLGIK
jgi:hypothetical protein